jgi:hypothetical protein
MSSLSPGQTDRLLAFNGGCNVTSSELKEIVDQRMTDPHVTGRLVCNLKSDAVEQKNNDGRLFKVLWQDDGDYWRCTLTDSTSGKLMAQVDIHENSTVRADLFEPGRITVSPEEGILCVTRYR